MRCQCNIESSGITGAGFQCFLTSSNAVTFRAKITGSRQATASELIEFLEDWTASGALISVQAQLLTADKDCAVGISSFQEPECQSDIPTQSGARGSGGVATGVGVILLLVLIFSVVAVVVVFYVIQRRKKPTSLPTNPHPSAVSSVVDHDEVLTLNSSTSSATAMYGHNSLFVTCT